MRTWDAFEWTVLVVLVAFLIFLVIVMGLAVTQPAPRCPDGQVMWFHREGKVTYHHCFPKP